MIVYEEGLPSHMPCFISAVVLLAAKVAALALAFLMLLPALLCAKLVGAAIAKDFLVLVHD